MGVIVHKETERHSELDDRIAADLRARTQQTKRADDPDLVDDTDYTKDLKKTSRFGWVWLVAVLAIVVAGIIIFMPKQ